MKITPQPIDLNKLAPIELVREVHVIGENRKLYNYKLKLSSKKEANKKQSENLKEQNQAND